jgi:hypothetical protein
VTRWLARLAALLALAGLITVALHPELLQVVPRPTHACGGIDAGRCT